MSSTNQTYAPDLLLWVGGKYYTIQAFIEEAQRLGISRRISSRALPEHAVLGKTRVFLVSTLDETDPNIEIKRVEHKKDIGEIRRFRSIRWKAKTPGYKPVPKVFGYFVLEGIVAIGQAKEEVVQKLQKAGFEVKVVPTYSPVLEDLRLCGRLVVGGVYLIDSKFKSRVEVKDLKEAGVKVSMIEGSLVTFPPIPAPGLKRFRGWQYVNGDAILQGKPVEEWFKFPPEFEEKLREEERKKRQERKQRRKSKQEAGQTQN